MVTSFTTALNDIEYLESQAWSCIFVDEAHRLKNSKSQTRIAFSRFTCVVRFGLTVSFMVVIVPKIPPSLSLLFFSGDRNPKQLCGTMEHIRLVKSGSPGFFEAVGQIGSPTTDPRTR